jgi:transposase
MYICASRLQDVCMSEAEIELEMLPGASRRRRTAQERRLIVEETFAAGSSVARVARKHGINANQVFQWRRMYREGQLGEQSPSGMKLLPVRVTEDAGLAERQQGEVVARRLGTIHIELPGRALISLEGNVDPAVVRTVLGSLRS